jgi:hypothetical protein
MVIIIARITATVMVTVIVTKFGSAKLG